MLNVLYTINQTSICVTQDMLGPEQAYEGLYGQGPPSVHSSHGGRAFQQGTYDDSYNFLCFFLNNNRF